MRGAAIVGAGVSGLTCGVVLAERGVRTDIFAAARGAATTSAAAAAIWYPYDTESGEDVMAWALATYRELAGLSKDSRTGVSMIELRCFSRAGEIDMPLWATPLGGHQLETRSEILEPFTSGFALRVPLMDTTRYLQYLEERFMRAGGSITEDRCFSELEEVSREYDLVINCSGIGAKTLVPDADLESHRGQVAVVRKLELAYAIACDGPPLMYAIPRANDCIFGGTNEVTESREPDPEATSRILSECSRILKIREPRVLAERVGLRPFRKGGVCLRAERLSDGRSVIHNYGHGGAGFTLSWGCAREVAELAALR